MEAKREANSLSDQIRGALGNTGSCTANLKNIKIIGLAPGTFATTTKLAVYDVASGKATLDAKGNQIYVVNTASAPTYWFKPTKIEIDPGTPMPPPSNPSSDHSTLGSITITDSRASTFTLSRSVPLMMNYNAAGKITSCIAGVNTSNDTLNRMCIVQSSNTQYWNAATQSCQPLVGADWVLGTNPFTVSCPAGKHLDMSVGGCNSKKPFGYIDVLKGVVRTYSNHRSSSTAPPPFNCHDNGDGTHTGCQCDPAVGLPSTTGFLAEAACL